MRNVQTVKQENKIKLAAYLQKEYGVTINPASMFDVHVSNCHIICHLHIWMHEIRNTLFVFVNVILLKYTFPFNLN